MIVKIKLGNTDQYVNISVGNGQQTIKWLGSVVQARVKQFGLLRTGFENEDYIVTEIRNENDELLNPLDRIFEHANSSTGFTAKATLVNGFPVDNWVNPALNEWMKTAFVKSSIGINFANEMEAWRDSLNTVKELPRDLNNAVLSPRSRSEKPNLVRIGFDFTEDDITSAFSLDWSAMKWNWLSITEHQMNLLGDCLKSHYSLVCNIFAHYAGYGQGIFNIFILF